MAEWHDREGVGIDDRVRILEAQNETLRLRLAEAEQTVSAIGEGEVDAFVISVRQGERIISMRGADHAYFAILENMREGAATLSADGHILYANRRLAELLGMPLASLTGSNLLDLVAAEDSYIGEALVKRGLRRESQGEVALVGRSGMRVPTQLLAFPIDMDGVETVAVLLSDLTELNRYRYDLEELIAARTAELTEANDRLLNEAHARDELVFQIVKELDAGLRDIRSALDQLLAGAGSPDPERRKDVERSLADLTLLLDDVCVLAELESGRGRMEYRRVSLRDVTLAAAQEARERAQSKGVEVVVDLPTEEFSFFSDHKKLSRSLLALLSVAVDLSAAGSKVPLVASASRDLQAVFEIPFTMYYRGGSAQTLSDKESFYDALKGTPTGLSIRCTERIASLLAGTLVVEAKGRDIRLRLEIAL